MIRVAHAVFDHVDSASADHDFAVEADVDNVDLDADGIQHNNAGIQHKTSRVRDNSAARHDFDVADHFDYCFVHLQDNISVKND